MLVTVQCCQHKHEFLIKLSQANTELGFNIWCRMNQNKVHSVRNIDSTPIDRFPLGKYLSISDRNAEMLFPFLFYSGNVQKLNQDINSLKFLLHIFIFFNAMFLVAQIK